MAYLNILDNIMRKNNYLINLLLLISMFLVLGFTAQEYVSVELQQRVDKMG